MKNSGLDNSVARPKEDEMTARCITLEWQTSPMQARPLTIYADLFYYESPAYQVLKRGIDLALALTGLAICSIPMILIAILVKLDSQGPALYWSYRVGKGNRLFRMPKFRTMHICTPETATCDLFHPDVYVTRFGRFLRQTSLDELPQIWNILIGNMSIVGPRPVIRSETQLITLRTQNQVHRLIPGLTGWAQIHGRDFVDVTRKVELDLHYLENRSFFMDLQIMGKTIRKVLMREGIHH
jgi:O-antigen biosynthesis protein WbqP